MLHLPSSSHNSGCRKHGIWHGLKLGNGSQVAARGDFALVKSVLGETVHARGSTAANMFSAVITVIGHDSGEPIAKMSPSNSEHASIHYCIKIRFYFAFDNFLPDGPQISNKIGPADKEC
jgi:hypothetical protein